MTAVLAFSLGSSLSHSIALSRRCFISSLLIESSIGKSEERASRGGDAIGEFPGGASGKLEDLEAACEPIGTIGELAGGPLGELSGAIENIVNCACRGDMSCERLN